MLEINGMKTNLNLNTERSSNHRMATVTQAASSLHCLYFRQTHKRSSDLTFHWLFNSLLQASAEQMVHRGYHLFVKILMLTWGQ